jgi:membrane AbrB-like protein
MQIKWLVILSAIAGGLLLDYLNIPAGAMVGSMLGTAVAQISIKTKLHISPPVKRIVRVVMGCYIGLGITIEGIIQLKGILGAAAIVIFGMIILSFVVAYMLHKFCGWSLPKAFLSALPAGLTEIGMNAEEFDVDPIDVTTIHVMRLITILAFVPLVLRLL